MLTHNQNVTGRKFELQAYVDVINTADAFKLSRLSKFSDSNEHIILEVSGGNMVAIRSL